MSPEIIELVEEELSSMEKKASLIGELLKYNGVPRSCPAYAHLEAAGQHIEQAKAAARGECRGEGSSARAATHGGSETA